MKFDGRGFADKIERDLVDKVRNLTTKPKIVSVLVGNDPASELYTRLKEEAAHRVGIDFEVQRISNIEYREFVRKIEQIGEREDVTGVMIQLPVPGLQGQALKDVLAEIPFNKDVDGLRYPESGVIPPVVRATLSIIEQIDREKFTIYNLQFTNIWEQKFAVMGAGGSVGSALCSQLERRGISVDKIDSETKDANRFVLEGDVVISCVGIEGLVTAEMVREGAIVIDVGAPKGDMAKEVYQKASVSVEVPGGVGPVTIATLMENALEISIRKR